MSRAKTRTKRLPTRRRKLHFRLTVEAQEMLVDYTPYWMEGGDPLGHFEFRSPHQPPRRIPVSETGYRSHFAPMPDIEAEVSPQEYARLVALAFIRRVPAAAARSEDADQLALF